MTEKILKSCNLSVYTAMSSATVPLDIVLILPLTVTVKKDPRVIELLGFYAKFDCMRHTTVPIVDGMFSSSSYHNSFITV